MKRRTFVRDAALWGGGTALFGGALACRSAGVASPQAGPAPAPAAPSPAAVAAPARSRVVAAAADDMLVDLDYNPAAVHRAFERGLTELTGEKTLAGAWSSLVSPDDVVGIKINCIGAPRVSSSPASINETVAGLKSAGVRKNAIVIWDRGDRDFRRTGLAINRGPAGVRVQGCSTEWEGVVPWVPGYDRSVFVSFEDGTLRRFRELAGRGFTRDATQRQIFNSVTWLWTLIQQGNAKAAKYDKEIRRLYTDYADREGIRRIADEVAGEFEGVVIEDEEKSCFADIVTRDITKLVNIAVLKHNEDSGVTWATKNIALGVTTNKVRFHIDYCEKAIPEILAQPCLRDKTVLHIGEAAKISTVSVAGAQIARDNRIFFSRDPVAMDRIGLDILEEKRAAQGLESIRDQATHIAACARRGLGTDDLSRIDLRPVRA
ncbi:MAG TPA: DUF362 domain-containing protein [Candidatus Aminicenantes bacterium]|nr:DUF362 domain-containing protein [Candidatus Aminicenantes bacterium]HRY65725.1 DUF362 domain-containing protein [Candidatus Aminicenantes bacterium]HRZ72639.1 DUF362 domain-containing protein [Candidatus Aminicenantes bacterium]